MSSAPRRFAAERHPLLKLGAAVAAFATFAAVWGGFALATDASGSQPAASPALAAPAANPTAPSAARTLVPNAPPSPRTPVPDAPPSSDGGAPPPPATPTPTVTSGSAPSTRPGTVPVQRRSRGS